MSGWLEPPTPSPDCRSQLLPLSSLLPKAFLRENSAEWGKHWGSDSRGRETGLGTHAPARAAEAATDGMTPLKQEGASQPTTQRPWYPQGGLGPGPECPRSWPCPRGRAPCPHTEGFCAPDLVPAGGGPKRQGGELEEEGESLAQGREPHLALDRRASGSSFDAGHGPHSGSPTPVCWAAGSLAFGGTCLVCQRLWCGEKQRGLHPAWVPD